MRSQLETIRELKIDLNWIYTENSRLQENFRFASPKDDYPTKFNPLESGSFSISTISLRTAFSKIDKTDSANAYNSPIFREFENNRHIIANRLAATDPYSVSVPTTVDGEFPTGYSGKSPDVLIPAFFATYTGKDLNSSSLDFRPTRIPLPNWNLTYNGLTRMKWAKKYFKSFNITHAYRSTYSVGNFTTNLMYLQDLLRYLQ